MESFYGWPSHVTFSLGHILERWHPQIMSREKQILLQHFKDWQLYSAQAFAEANSGTETHWHKCVDL